MGSGEATGLILTPVVPTPWVSKLIPRLLSSLTHHYSRGRRWWLTTEEAPGNGGPPYDVEPTSGRPGSKPVPKEYDQGSTWGPGDCSSFLPSSQPPPPAQQGLCSLSSPQHSRLLNPGGPRGLQKAQLSTPSSRVRPPSSP